MKIKDTKEPNLFFKLSKLYKQRKRFFRVSIIIMLVFIIVILSFGFGVNYGIKNRFTNRIGAIKGLLNNVKKTGYRIIPNIVTGAFSKPERFYIDIKHMDFQKIMYNRQISLNRGVILEDVKQEKFPATLTYKNNAYKVKLEMIGQNLDHISRAEKWSLKVGVSGDNAVLGMKEFSFLVPDARGTYHHNPVNEWVCHQLEKAEGLITLRYDFVHVTINGKALGVYALEEHFDKHLIEHNNLREGIIFKPGMQDISVYNENKILADPTLKSQLSLLKVIWQSFIVNDLPANKLFDIEKLAKRYAIADLVNGHHIHWLGNTMFYFNPVTRLLEPIGREWESPSYREVSLYIENPIYEPIFHQKIFKDPIFVEAYLGELDRISKTEYLDDFFTTIDQELEEKLKILNRDYPAYQYDRQYLYENQTAIRKILYPYQPAVVAYLENIDTDSFTISTANVHSLPVYISDAINSKGLVFTPKQDKLLSGTRKGESPRYEYLSFAFPQDFIATADNLADLKIRYNCVGLEERRECIVIPWAQVNIEKFSQYPVSNDQDFVNLEFLTVDQENQSIYIKKGSWKLESNLIIPSGFKLVCSEGTHLDLVNSAKILSYSPLIFSGTEDNPISIGSSDSSGQGIIVLKAQQQSIMKYVFFKDLSNSRQSGWELTGGITFYESPVEFDNCRFSNNRIGDDFVNLIRSNFLMSTCLFENSFADALDADFCNGTIVNTVFINCGNDAVDASGSIIEFSDITIKGAGDKGISAGERSHIIATRTKIENAAIAAASKDMSELVIHGIHISNGQIGFAAYQKKPEFGPSAIQATNIEIENVEIPFLIEEGSSLLADGEKVESSRKNVKDILYGVEFGKSSK